MKNQNALVLEALRESPNSWIPMVELGHRAGCWAVHSRVSDLRGEGWDIINRVRKEGNVRISYYMLVEG